MAGLNGQLSELKIESTYLAEMIPISIYKPPHYTPLKSYRLLICQDGQDYFRLGRIPRQAEALMEEGDIEEAVIVGVPYPSVPTRRKWYHPEGEDAKSYRRFLACELLPFLEQEMSTEPLPEARILAGDSLAATVSLQTALEYPNIFGKVVLHSPFVSEPVLEQVNQFSNSHSLTIYHVIGLEETEVTLTNGDVADFLTPNRKLNKLLEQGPFSYTYHEFQGNHTWTYWQKDLPRALQTVLPLA
ncbi:alpha/beta hydrolase [Shouchella clausii]|uniref:Esterase family protein n=1 Tax=Shouchella clausii TaxID=79880 RepID=A0A268P5H3_SHOCL|nr:alpha/beta hydrolase-fold protein [Shouchella clausii]PAD18332.1 hypothetical protein CHH73_06940 [Shouchella clausii]PAE90555.1 hypothetical protein CHH72_01325 [Shouchella clausii]